MRHIGYATVLVMFTVPAAVWGQGSGRAGRAAGMQQQGTQQQAVPQQATPQQPAISGRGGRGGAAGAGAESNEFFNYDPNAGSEAAIPETAPSETHQKITLNGEALAYTTRAGYLPLRNATTGRSEAHVFYTYYAKDGGGDSARRPLLFFLAGAPGVAAAWQDFGGLGPKRMKWASDGSAGAAPFVWVENPHTLLGQADLVFVNPVGTAFSRPDSPARGPSFWNTTADTASMGEFVRSFLQTNNRGNSPLFLAGEDAGTGRAAGLAAYLTEHDIPVSGVVLLSMTMSADAQAGDAEFLTTLPSMVMAAWHQKKLAPDMNAMSSEQIAGRARQFASREYLHALYKGDRMTADDRGKVVADMVRLTGLSRAFLVNNDLRIPLDRFCSELLRDRQRTLSKSDARVSGFQPAAGGGRGGRGFFGFGPANTIDFDLSGKSSGFETAYEDYLRRELGFHGNGLFYLSSGGIGTFTSTGNDDANLATAFARNPNMRLYVAMNYYDLNAPFYAAEFTLAHLSVAPDVRAHNITVGHFESGQMTYADDQALAKLHGELASFLNHTSN